MAKKRRKHEEEKEEKEYKSPEFNEREFITEEMLTAKATIIAFIIAFPMAIVAYAVNDSAGAGIGFMIGLLGFVVIWMLLPYFNIDIALFKAKHWLGIFSTYFFAFLAIWILTVNPPFADHAGPQFVTIDFEIGGEQIIILGVDNDTKIELREFDVDAGANITIDARITDNDLMGAVTIFVGNAEYSMSSNPDSHYTYELVNAAQNIAVTMVAHDNAGNSRSYEIFLT